jgi:glycosyltransferase involved in cell wall biosynthesis
VIICDNQDAPYFEQMQRARLATGDLAESIRILGEVPYSEIRRYYAEARLFVFPSYLESFGLPLLEAMASDLPIVASDLPTFREVAQDAAFYADPHDAHSLAAAMHSALFAPGASEVLVKRGRERVRAFRWERTAGELMALFESVIRERQFRSKERARRPLFGDYSVPEMLPIAARSIID